LQQRYVNDRLAKRTHATFLINCKRHY